MSHLINGINDFYNEGYLVGEIKSDLKDICLQSLLSEKFVVQEMEKGTHNQNLREYQSRFISQSSINFETKEIYDEIVNDIENSLNPIIRLEGKKISTDYQIFMGKKGYFMERHNDLGDRTTMIVLAYFANEFFEPEDCGQLKVYNNKTGSSTSITPQNGTFVVLNAMNPIFEHEAVVNNSDKNRIHIFISINCKSL